MSRATLNLILAKFKDNNLEYVHYNHDPIPKDSIGAAKVRGLSIDSGAKAIVFQSKKGDFYQIILSGHRRVDLKKFKEIVNEKNISLAKPQAVLKLTDCVVGTVPPMGVLFNIPVFIDRLILDKEEIVFSAGTDTDTIKTNPNNLAKLNNATVIDISMNFS